MQLNSIEASYIVISICKFKKKSMVLTLKTFSQDKKAYIEEITPIDIEEYVLYPLHNVFYQYVEIS